MTTKSHAGAAAKENGSGSDCPFMADGIARVNSSPRERQLAVRGFKPFLPTPLMKRK